MKIKSKWSVISFVFGVLPGLFIILLMNFPTSWMTYDVLQMFLVILIPLFSIFAVIFGIIGLIKKDIFALTGIIFAIGAVVMFFLLKGACC